MHSTSVVRNDKETEAGFSYLCSRDRCDVDSVVVLFHRRRYYNYVIVKETYSKICVYKTKPEAMHTV